MRASIEDVAKLAGVSPATVSRVLNRPSIVNAQTREKVLEAVKKLDYYPKSAAQRLATGKSQMFGFVSMVKSHSIIHASSWQFYLRVFQGVNDTLRKAKEQNNIGLRCWMDMETYEDVEKTKLFQKLAKSNEIDGLFILMQWEYPESFLWNLGDLHRLGFPFVIINYSFSHRDFYCVSNQYQTLAKMAIEHFKSMGREKISYIAGPEDNLSTKERTKGYFKIMKELGLEISGDYYQVSDFDSASGYQCAQKLLNLSARPNAIFCVNDRVAAGAIMAIKNAGLRCPEDVAVIGSDDDEICRVTSPKITTFRLPLYQIGEEAARIMLSGFAEGKWEKRQRVFSYEPELVQRESTLGRGVICS
ncbi:MAG: LacI family DNA-binding transcriptional regulator [Bacteroidota bacterium]